MAATLGENEPVDLARQATINFTGTVKSPKKLSGKISISAFSAEVAPGITSACQAASVTFSVKHS